jgi:hypothetical protein
MSNANASSSNKNITFLCGAVRSRNSSMKRRRKLELLFLDRVMSASFNWSDLSSLHQQIGNAACDPLESVSAAPFRHAGR